MVVAMVFGLTYGSGLIINHVRTGRVTAKKPRLLAPLWPFPALIEDTILFLSWASPLLAAAPTAPGLCGGLLREQMDCGAFS